MVKMDQWEQRLSAGDDTDILQDTKSVLQEESEKLFIIVKVQLGVSTCWVVISLRMANLDSPSEHYFKPLGPVSQNCWVGSNVWMPKKLGPELIGHVGD